MSADEGSVIQSERTKVQVHKVSAALFWIFVAVVISLSSYGRTKFDYVLVAVSGVLVIFHGSIAAVRVRNEIVEYRRLVTWHAIPLSSVGRCGSLGPLGWVKLDHFVAPWGRIWFALDEGVKSSFFGERDYLILKFLRREISSIDQESALTPTKRPIGPATQCVLAFAAGVCLPFVFSIIQPGAISQPSVLDNRLSVRILYWLSSESSVVLAVNVVALAVFGFLTINRWRKASSWPFAFLFGANLASVLITLVRMA